NNYNELCLYVGILPLLLSVFSIRYFFSDAAIAFYSTSAAVFLTMAMGSVLYYPLASYVPGLDTTTPTRILYLFGFCMSVMAAAGADRLLRAQGRDRFAAAAVAALVLAAALALSAVVQTHPGKMWAGGMERLMGIPSVSERIDEHFSLLSKSMLKPLLLVLAAAVLISSAALTSKVSRKKVLLFIAVCLTSYDLLSFGLHYNTTTPKSMAYPETGGIRYLKNDPTLFRTIHFGNFSPNFLSAFGIEDVGGYQSIYPKRYGEFIHLSQYGPDMPLPDHFSRWMQFVRFGLPVLHILNTKYILLPTSARLEASTYPLVYDGEIKIYRNRKAFPRAFFVPEQQFCSSREEAFQLLSTYSISDFRKRVILEAPETEKPDSSQPIGREGHATISWLRNQPGLLDIAVAAETDGYLVIGDGFHPGWKATVDEVKTDVWRANYIMRAVRIPAGNHRVLMRFRPAMLTAGAAATLLGWTFWLSVTAAALLRRKSGKSLR
ncbi:MAG: YfhO family protein, partial [Desulfobacteraceae bacterium]|nr:YfhO family protein [Desulfobacteraceae bacterium]